MSDLETLIRCALNDRIEVAVAPILGKADFVESFDDCMERLRTIGEATVHFVLSKHRRENAYVHMGIDHPILDHTHGGYIDAVLYPCS